jgi:hypothetical protein
MLKRVVTRESPAIQTGSATLAIKKLASINPMPANAAHSPRALPSAP